MIMWILVVVTGVLFIERGYCLNCDLPLGATTLDSSPCNADDLRLRDSTATDFYSCDEESGVRPPPPLTTADDDDLL